MKTAFIFPGQGAQHVGMGEKYFDLTPEITALVNQANDILGYDIKQVCLEGPAEKLDTTAVSQPAIFVTSVVVLTAARLGKLSPELAEMTPDMYAGLSLGEYTALYASGVMDFEQALKLVQLRGKSMQQAAEMRQGTMVSIMGLGEPDVIGICDTVLKENIEEDDQLETILSPVNFNSPGQIVVSGSLKACERAAEVTSELDGARAIPLSVAGAFHTKMMQPAVDQLSQAIAQTGFNEFSVPVIANVDALCYDSVGQISEKLLSQLVSPVRWQQSIESLLDQGYERFIEMGPGRVLTGLVKKIARAKKIKPVIENIS